MASKNVKQRKEIDEKFKWDIEAMYTPETKWQEDFDASLKAASEYGRFKGRLGESAAVLKEALKEKDRIWQQAERVYVYARMRRDEDNRVGKYVEMAGKCHVLLSEISSSLSFFTPELLAVDEKVIFGYLDADKELEIYRHYIEDTFRIKAHVLSEVEENLLAQISRITDASGEIFNTLNNADIKFGRIIDEDGDSVELTHGNFISFMESKDRRVRQEAFQHMYASYTAQINTIATAYDYNVRTGCIFSKLRKYENARAGALSGDNVKEEVYDNLIKVVNDYLPSLHQYMKTRKRLLGVEPLKMYDIYVPLVDVPERKISFDDAVQLMNEGLAPLGPEYLDVVNHGIRSRWVDIYENEGKTSGAYSFGSYDSMPYIMMNFAGKLKDAFTLIHEMGHSMHSYFTRNTQPFVYGGHSIFTAEVASTVNEALMMQRMLATEKDAAMKKYLLNIYIEEFRTTLFRQTMFAEFEDMTHKASEAGTILTPEWLCREYKKLNEKYFGEAVDLGDEIQYEWARIPHFYRAFYVYKYATGYSAATAISKILLQGGESERHDYIRFLRSGDSDYPIELLKIAGVDMSTEQPIKEALETFKTLVTEFDSL